jgi:peptidoglycan/xylan/chitin deacetylase (PgdA/CDA1 family)
MPEIKMSVRAVLKYTAPFIARYSGIAKALAFRYSGPGTIFFLHSVGDTFFPDELLSCPTPVLEAALSWFRRNRIRVVSLDEAVDRLNARSIEKFCVITFDDGFADNLVHALPIMERYKAPFTVYVANGMVTGEIDAWWLGLAKLIRIEDFVELPELGLRFDCNDALSKKRAFNAIRAFIEAKWEVALQPTREAIAAYGIDTRALARAKGLTTEQLQQLAASPLVTIGAHGVRHINLARASADEVEQEMMGSRRSLEQAIGREVKHFAYAFGACGPREAQIAKRLGFRTAVTSQHGTLFPQHVNHLHELPREPLDRNDTPSSLRCKLGGTYRAYYSNLGYPIAHL